MANNIKHILGGGGNKRRPPTRRPIPPSRPDTGSKVPPRRPPRPIPPGNKRNPRNPRWTPNDFDPTTQGMGYQEMARRTQQHNILATKKYEAYKNLNLGVDAAWVNKSTRGNEMNPWVMQKIGQMVGQQDRANANMRAALKMWDTASKFEVAKSSRYLDLSVGTIGKYGVDY